MQNGLSAQAPRNGMQLPANTNELAVDQPSTYPELAERTLCLVQMSRIGIKVALDFNTDALTALFNASTCYGVQNLVVTRTKCAITRVGWGV